MKYLMYGGVYEGEKSVFSTRRAALGEAKKRGDESYLFPAYISDFENHLLSLYTRRTDGAEARVCTQEYRVGYYGSSANPPTT